MCVYMCVKVLAHECIWLSSLIEKEAAPASNTLSYLSILITCFAFAFIVGCSYYYLCYYVADVLNGFYHYTTQIHTPHMASSILWIHTKNKRKTLGGTFYNK